LRQQHKLAQADPDETEGGQMDILEIEQKESMSREEAAARLRTFADNLARNNDLEFERGGMQPQGPCSRRGAGQGGA
jgi:hypothetical protein